MHQADDESPDRQHRPAGERHLTAVAVVGGGIVGLATAHCLLAARPDLGVVVLEKERDVGRHQTGHNSGVVHSGLYYKPGSTKAETCVRGAAALVAFCRAHAIPLDVCGKVVVATTPAEVPRLDELERRGRANGVPGLARVDADGLRAIEPAAAGIAALHVPGAAAVDYGAVARKLAELVEAAGGDVRRGAHATAIERVPGGAVVRTRGAGDVRARLVVTCAGLHSDRVARTTTPHLTTRIVPFRGEYYVLAPERQELVRGMIYPVPDPRFPFLGVHFTRTVGGAVEAGPNAVLALRREGYRWRDVSLRDTAETLAFPGFWRLARRYWRTGAGEMWRSLSKSAFTRALRTLVPDVRRGDLRRGGAGVRAQALDRDGTMVEDFAIVDDGPVIHVLNAPSPAATACLAIGEQLAARAIAHLR